ncbi:MAG: SGNH/GDSL hydrolase family protein [Bacteroidia bacterium]
MKRIHLILPFLILLSVNEGCTANPETATINSKDSAAIRYVALGDSYTICTGATEMQSWPVNLAADLTAKKIPVSLIANPSRNGWTTQDLIDNELAVFDKSDADAVTVLIGVNDWVQGVDVETFRKNLKFILDHLQKKLKDKQNILLITIPDFGVTPTGKNYSGGRNISAGIMEFNDVIKEEAKNRNLPLIDIFETTKAMGTDSSLVAADGLHPSAKEYAIWEKMILVEFEKMIQ